MFAKRHEQELGELRTLTSELDRRAREGLKTAEGIRKRQRAQERALQRARRVRPRSPDPGRARQNGASEPLIAFVHIPKTAGGTVTAMFAEAYSRAGISKAGNFMRGPEKAASKLARNPGGWDLWGATGGRVAVGHSPYGVFRLHLPEETRYMTFLREPVDRVISHFYRHVWRRNPERAGSAKERERGIARANTLEEALVEMRMPQLNNLATRFLCGDPSPMGDLRPTALEDAKENLRGFAFVGIQERFEESLGLLQRLLALEDVPREAFEDRHVSSAGGRPSVDEIPDDQRALIAEHNRLDAELYAFGLELFEEALAESAGERS